MAWGTSCAPPPELALGRHGGRRPLRDWTLRTRLIASFLGLLVLLCTGIGLVTDLALSRSLTGQLDKQLLTAGGMSARDSEHDQPGPGSANGSDPRRFLLPPGNPIGSIGAIIAGRTVVGSALQDGSDTRPPVSAAVQRRLLGLDPDGRPHSVRLPGLGQYRVIARTMADGDVLVSGFSLRSVSSTLTNLTLVITGLAVLGMVIAALAGVLIIGLAMRHGCTRYWPTCWPTLARTRRPAPRCGSACAGKVIGRCWTSATTAPAYRLS